MDAAGYDPGYKKWRYDDLPILPEPFRYVLVKGKEDAFQNLKRLMERPDVTELVNACDAGREGELIFRTVYCLAGCQKPMKRLWISSMEDSAIREGFEHLRSGADYDGLYQAALCRAKADWLVGINATRLFSVLYHRTLNIGRVMSPTLALIVQREAEIDAFKPVPFYSVALDLPGFTAASWSLPPTLPSCWPSKGPRFMIWMPSPPCRRPWRELPGDADLGRVFPGPSGGVGGR